MRSCWKVYSIAIFAALALLAGRGTALAVSSNPGTYFFANGDQWGLSGSAASINVGPAWCKSTGVGVVLADIDTGADFNHPDLAGRLIAGARFTNGDGTQSAGGVQDDFGHGTMTTGIMVANTKLASGMAGIAYGGQALVLKVLVPATDPTTGQQTASGSINDVAAGINYAVSHGANVINLSIGSGIPLTGLTFQPVLDAIKNAYNNNVAVAVAAGNNSLPVSDYQSIEPYALVYGALGPNGIAAYYSTSGVGVNAWAPGGDDTQSKHGSDQLNMVVSTYLGDAQNHNKFVAEEGTSFAAPHAAGVLGLLFALDHNASADRQRVLDTLRAGTYLAVDAARALGTSATCSDPPGGPTPSSGPPPPVGSPPIVGPGGHGGGSGGPTASPAGSPVPQTSPTPLRHGQRPSPNGTVSPSPEQLALVPRTPGPNGPPGAAVPSPRGLSVPLWAIGAISVGLVVAVAAVVWVRPHWRTGST